jgi:flagellar biosynthetic protein FliQ
METTQLTTLFQEALLLIILLVTLPLTACFVTGLIVNVVQAATQMTDPVLNHIPRLIAVIATLIIAGPWIWSRIIRFTMLVFSFGF